MKLKHTFLSSLFVAVSVLCASEVGKFTVPKVEKKNNGNTSAKKTRENIITKKIDILEKVVERDLISLELRSIFQTELKAGLCGEDVALINSSSKSALQENLNLLEKLDQELLNQNKVMQVKVNELKIKIKSIKA